jgi:thioredoxin 1
MFVIACVALSQPKNTPSPAKSDGIRKPLVTFVELGSVKCIPCRQMQPVMASVEKKYGDQITVVFHDVWMSDQRQYAETYGIRVIPTQVFLDKDGKEFHRHEGFYPEAEIDKLLQQRGLKVRTGG